MNNDYDVVFQHDVDGEILTMVVEAAEIVNYLGSAETTVRELQEMVEYYEEQGFTDLYFDYDADNEGLLLIGDIRKDDFEENPLLNAEGGAY